MKILVTGGTGVIGPGVIPHLESRGHQVKLLSRNADRDVAQFSSEVEAFSGDVGDRDSIRGSADGCDLVLHIAGIAHEEPPEVTFAAVNVEGTRNLVDEASRAGVSRFVYISSLGADRGTSDYHRSKFAAEQIVRSFKGSWTVIRPGNVYGPGDEVISVLLKMVRTLPVIPVIDDGAQQFQPIWFEDLAAVLVNLIEHPELDGKAYEVAGNQKTSMNDLIQRFSDITGRSPKRVPVPNSIVSVASNVATFLGIDVPIDDEKLTMLQEENVVRDPAGNAIASVFKVTPTTLDVGVRKLADCNPEQLPQEGVGRMDVKQFTTTITGSPYSLDEVFNLFIAQFAQLMPMETGGEPQANEAVELGATLTLSLPLRGNAQVRVAELKGHTLTLTTLEGHPLAGAVRFSFEKADGAMRFVIRTFDRSATFFDLVAMRTVGGAMQNATWEGLIERVAGLAGGTHDRVARTRETASAEEAEEIENWITGLVMTRKRESAAEEIQPRPA